MMYEEDNEDIAKKKKRKMDSQGFPVVPDDQKFADDLGYVEKIKKTLQKRKVK